MEQEHIPPFGGAFSRDDCLFDTETPSSIQSLLSQSEQPSQGSEISSLLVDSYSGDVPLTRFLASVCCELDPTSDENSAEDEEEQKIIDILSSIWSQGFNASIADAIFDNFKGFPVFLKRLASTDHTFRTNVLAQLKFHPNSLFLRYMKMSFDKQELEKLAHEKFTMGMSSCVGVLDRISVLATAGPQAAARCGAFLRRVHRVALNMKDMEKNEVGYVEDDDIVREISAIDGHKERTIMILWETASKALGFPAVVQSSIARLVHNPRIPTEKLLDPHLNTLVNSISSSCLMNISRFCPIISESCFKCSVGHGRRCVRSICQCRSASHSAIVSIMLALGSAESAQTSAQIAQDNFFPVVAEYTKFCHQHLPKNVDWDQGASAKATEFHTTLIRLFENSSVNLVKSAYCVSTLLVLGLLNSWIRLFEEDHRSVLERQAMADSDSDDDYTMPSFSISSSSMKRICLLVRVLLLSGNPCNHIQEYVQHSLIPTVTCCSDISKATLNNVFGI